MRIGIIPPSQPTGYSLSSQISGANGLPGSVPCAKASLCLCHSCNIRANPQIQDIWRMGDGNRDLCQGVVEFLCEYREDLQNIAHNTVIRYRKNGGVWILVDRHDTF